MRIRLIDCVNFQESCHARRSLVRIAAAGRLTLRESRFPMRKAAVTAVVIVLVAAIPAVRHTALRWLGGALIARDSVDTGDVVAISESGDDREFQAAEIEAADLYQRHAFARVMVLLPSPGEMDDELARRGVRIENPVLATLRQLGVPAGALTLVEAGEGGTTESTRALAAWAHDHPSRIVVIIGAAHSRRYRRTLARTWPSGVPPPRVTFPARTPFRAGDWWRSRRTLRDGLFELEKLAWDFVSHPWPPRLPSH